jgi:hypothetical protein
VNHPDLFDVACFAFSLAALLFGIDALAARLGDWLRRNP